MSTRDVFGIVVLVGGLLGIGWGTLALNGVAQRFSMREQARANVVPAEFRAVGLPGAVKVCFLVGAFIGLQLLLSTQLAIVGTLIVSVPWYVVSLRQARRRESEVIAEVERQAASMTRVQLEELVTGLEAVYGRREMRPLRALAARHPGDR